ncbi:MAG: hypothetical protein EXR52_02315 [Dehalococcoidia bacterium]|nr:hypothetical protein [Dehalococcoidia bacterium]
MASRCIIAAPARSPSDRLTQRDVSSFIPACYHPPSRSASMILPTVVAHRGASGDTPENTLAAFDRAVALGCPDIELDVQVTRDGVPVVLHDTTLDRTTDVVAHAEVMGPSAGSGRTEGTRVDALTLAQLRTLDAGAWFGDQFAGQSVPSLEEVLARYVGQARFTVEIKVPGVGLEAKVLGLLTRYGMRSSASLCSFLPEVLAALEPVAGSMPVWFNVPQLTQASIVEALRLRASGIAAPIATLTTDKVAEAGDRGLLVAAWGMTSEAEVQRATAWELDRVICDRPDAVLGFINRSTAVRG